jgi:hypothetical protein
MKDCFRHFVRIQYPGVELDNEGLDEMWPEFDKYLRNIVGDEKAEKWYPKSPMEVILASEHPFKMFGYEPALVLHFGNFVKEMHENPPSD